MPCTVALADAATSRSVRTLSIWVRRQSAIMAPESWPLRQMDRAATTRTLLGHDVRRAEGLCGHGWPCIPELVFAPATSAAETVIEDAGPRSELGALRDEGRALSRDPASRSPTSPPFRCGTSCSAGPTNAGPRLPIRQTRWVMPTGPRHPRSRTSAPSAQDRGVRTFGSTVGQVRRVGRNWSTSCTIAALTTPGSATFRTTRCASTPAKARPLGLAQKASSIAASERRSRLRCAQSADRHQHPGRTGRDARCGA